MKEDRYAIKLEREHYPIVEKYLDDPRYNNVLVIGLTTPGTRSSLRRFLNIKNRVERRGGNCIGIEHPEVCELLDEYIALKAVEGDFDFLKKGFPSSIGYLIDLAEKSGDLSEIQSYFKCWLEGKLYGQTAQNVRDILASSLGELAHNLSLHNKIMEEIGIVYDDAKELKTIKDESIDLILAFGLFGELDLTKFQHRYYTESIRDRFSLRHEEVIKEIKEILETYERRCEEVVDSMYRVLKPKGKCIISNDNEEQLTEFKSIIEKLGYQPKYDQEFYRKLFGKKFSDIKVFNGSARYLMVCEKE